MKKYSKKQLEEIKQINDFLNRFKKSSSIVVPNDFYRNAEIEINEYDTTILT